MTKKKEKRYEKPELKTLFNDLQAALGQCEAGIGDSSGCGGGIGPVAVHRRRTVAHAGHHRPAVYRDRL